MWMSHLGISTHLLSLPRELQEIAGSGLTLADRMLLKFEGGWTTLDPLWTDYKY